MIHICYCLFDPTGLYSKFVGTSMLSIFENTSSPVTIHIVHDNTLSTDNINKFALISNRYNQTLELHNVEELCPEDIAEIKKLQPRAIKRRYTIGMYYRFFVPHILSPKIEKVIYLDSDVIVNLDIDEYWNIDLGQKVFGVITFNFQKSNPLPDKDEHSFNSGSLLMNMQALRDEDENLRKSIKFLSEETKGAANDQDILNYCFQKKTLHLPKKFNRLVKWCRRQSVMQIEAEIYHFNGSNSEESFGFDMKDPFNRLWMSYFMKTPFFDTGSIGRLYETFRQMRYELENYALKISAVMPGKDRAFFVEPEQVPDVKKFFSIRGNEEIVLAENENSLEKLIAAMKESHSKKLFFILTKTFLKKSFPFEKLTKAGFVHGRDFVKAWRLLSNKQGESFDSRPLIKAM